MGIYIKGMHVPKSCWECPCDYGEFMDCICGLTEQSTREFRGERRDDCPLVEVPPHGQLTDADGVISPMEKTFENFDEIFKGFPEPERKFVKGIQNGFIKYIKDQPTVIPAEEEQ